MCNEAEDVMYLVPRVGRRCPGSAIAISASVHMREGSKVLLHRQHNACSSIDLTYRYQLFHCIHIVRRVSQRKRHYSGCQFSLTLSRQDGPEKSVADATRH